MNQFPLVLPRMCRGVLVYRQEDGYMMITITISVTPDEYCQVISHAFGLPIEEEAEHLPGLDVYHFVVSCGTKVELSVALPMGVEEVGYRVSRHTVLRVASSLYLSIVRSNGSVI